MSENGFESLNVSLVD